MRYDLKVLRYRNGNDDTLGLFFGLNGQFEAYTLEDEARTQKVFGETRIPAGTYRVQLRTEGSTHARYLKKFGADFHKGMLHVIGVPNFQWILIHIGNHDDDTAGCLLVGSQPNSIHEPKGFISGSTQAYKKVYPPITQAILDGHEVYITYEDTKHELNWN